MKNLHSSTSVCSCGVVIPREEKGFALVVAMLVLALLVVAAVGAAMFLQVEVRTGANAKKIAEARQNALFGLEIALGQLQELAGPDQRVTATATVAFPSKNELAVMLKNRANTAPRKTFLTPAERETFNRDILTWWDGKNPRWTGVWNSALRRDSQVPANRFGEPLRSQSPHWLISGNAGKQPGDAGYFTPDQSLPDPDADDAFVWLVNTGSATDAASSSDSMEGRVKAPKVEIRDPVSGVGASVGHYAYWVADESVKANFAVHDPFAEDDLTAKPGMGIGTREYRNRLLVPQRIGWENLDRFFPLFQSGETEVRPNDSSIGKIVASAQIPLLDSEFVLPVKESFHSLTAFSSGLFTDTALGGLRRDLTAFLQSGSGLSDSDTIMDAAKYVPADPRFGSSNSGFPASLNSLPRWSQIRDWYNNTGDNSAPVEVGPGFAPIVTRYSFHYSFTREGNIIRMHILPSFTLWNPFDAPLESTEYRLRVRKNLRFYYFGVATPGKADPTPGDANDGYAHAGYFIHKLRGLGWYADSATNAKKFNTDFRDSRAPWDIAGNRPNYNFSPFDRTTGINSAAPKWNEPGATWVEYRFTATFAPGQSRVFTVAPRPFVNEPDFDSKLWPKNAAHLHSGQDELSQAVYIQLQSNAFSTDFPPSYYFDIAEIVDVGGTGATLPETTDLMRFYGEISNEFFPFISMQLYAGTQELWSNPNMGFSTSFNTLLNIRYTASGEPDRTWANNPSTWRHLVQTPDFPLIAKGSTETRSRSYPLVSWTRGSLTPFDVPGWMTHRHQESLARWFRGFASTNLNARSLSIHPNLEGGMALSNVNNSNRFAPVLPVANSGNAFFPWDEEQADADSQGYSLVAWNRKGPRGQLGLSELPLRLVRRADAEVLSLGQLQQVNLSEYFWQPTFPIANSEASPWVDRSRVAGLQAYPLGASTSSSNALLNFRSATTFPNNAANDFIDLSFLLNESLWDSFFLSSISRSGALGLDNSQPLANSRFRFRLNTGFSESEVRDFEQAAAFLENKGAFNVNSTSVESWKALLTAFRGLAIQGAADNQRNPDESVPISRDLVPQSGPVGFDFDSKNNAHIGAVTDNRDYSRIFKGFRYLTDEMLDALAKRIVDEVRLRGPFLSIADFVNRRLVAPDGAGNTSSSWYLARTMNQGLSINTDGNNPGRIGANYDPLVGINGINGALQRAINLSGINGGVNYPHANADRDRVYFTTNDPATLENLQPMVQLSDMAFYLDTEHLTGNPAGEPGQLLSHSPGFITQGDLLAMIGPALTARGDTFLIRSYGDTTNPRTGKTEARAWLEAVVQRVPEPVAPAGTSGSSRWETTEELGRKFRVISMRWLAPEEV